MFDNGRCRTLRQRVRRLDRPRVDVGLSVGASLQVAAVAPAGWLQGLQPDPPREAALSALLDRVRARFGIGMLDYGAVRRSPWMGRKIAFERIPGHEEPIRAAGVG